MPTANDATATTGNAGLRSSQRTAQRTSERMEASTGSAHYLLLVVPRPPQCIADVVVHLLAAELECQENRAAVMRVVRQEVPERVIGTAREILQLQAVVDRRSQPAFDRDG